MRYGLALILLGVAQIVFARNAGLSAWLLWWSGLSWAWAGCAYGFIGAKAFGKRPDGTLGGLNVLLLFPYLAVTWLLWYVQKTLTKESCHNEIVPDLWLGRRCSNHELPPGVMLVVDLTAEFREPTKVRAGRTYLCVPTLDASVPPLPAFRELIGTVADFEGPIYVHCALGHGRSATVIVAALIARGSAASLDQAERMVKQARPGIEINAAQRRFLHHWSSQRQTIPKMGG